MAPNYANIFKYDIERVVVQKWTDTHHLLLYLRYLDDIFAVFHGSNTLASKFIDELNQQHSSIKFCGECSTSSITFLDLQIFKGVRFKKDNLLDIKTYVKPNNQFLSSFHLFSSAFINRLLLLANFLVIFGTRLPLKTISKYVMLSSIVFALGVFPKFY
jgi:hypothetical protein